MVLFSPIAPEFKVNSSNIFVNTITNPDVAVASNGNFVIVWEEPFQGDNNDKDIKFRRFAPDGTPLDVNDRIVANEEFNETQPVVAIAPNGDFVVAYVKIDDIYVRRFTAIGNPLGDEILVSTFEQDKIQSDPDIAIDEEGDFTVVWTHQFEADDLDIRGRIFNANGTPQIDDSPVANTSNNESEASIAIIPTANNDNSSDILAGVVSYTTDTNGNNDIFFLPFGNEGNPLDNPINAVPETNRSNNQRESSVAIDNNGNFVISWTHEFDDTDDDVYFRRFSVDGNPLDDVEIIVDSAFDDQNESQIALGNDGTIVVAYEDDSANSVKYRQFNSNGDEISDSQNYDLNSSFEDNPAIAIGANNRMVITADDDETNTFEPYARVYQPNLDTPLNRFQNEDVPGTYLFATEEESVTIRQDFPNFIEEGQAFSVSLEPKDNLIRFNRFQNEDVPGTYLFATEGESVSIRQNFPNFIEEGIAFYAYDADADIASDFYRFQNTQQPGTYLFVGEEEKDNILNDFPQFELEGVAFEAAF